MKTVPLPAEYKNGATGLFVKHVNDLVLERVRPAGGRIHPPLLAVHILPEGFHRIRYYGFLGNGHRKEKLEQCRHALGTVSLEETVSSERAEQDLSRPPRGALTGSPLWECSVCHRGRMIVIRAIDPCASSGLTEAS